ncbi:MAG: glycosyltransferase family 2 protein [Candidatus Eremiobacteraeota bacterium]|nr:glycosyltransferase family 2 protein [Candidatus Eremiobacteraeota bacterium]
MSPSVSVVIPCYNAGPFLAECLTSVLAQTRRPVEVIIVDDGSTDDSREVAARFPVRLLSTKGRQGHLVARAIAVEAAIGDYVAMIDADDRWGPDHLEATAALLDRHPDVALAVSDAQEFGKWNGVFLAAVPSDAPGDVFWRAFQDSYVPNIALVVRRDALHRALADHEVVNTWASDYLVNLRLAYAAPVVATGRPTTYWRRHDAQMTASNWRQRTTVHRHRAHFIAEVRDKETPERVREMQRLALQYWQEDVQRAIWDRDPVFLDALLGVASFIPNVPLRTLAWGHGRLHFGRLYDSPVMAPVRGTYRLARRVTGLSSSDGVVAHA